MTTAPLDAEVGRVLGGRFRLLALIGSGASARVYLADDITLRRRVAVKVLHAGLAADSAFLSRFRQEAQSAAALNNPHVLGVYDWGNDDVAYLVTEYLAGGSLRSMLSEGHRLDSSQALLVGLEAARGLDYAHGKQLIHRDIKPANLLFDESGRLRIADFGLARAIAEAGWTEEESSLVGTARYAAPEQARGERVGPAADVYALALVINEAVSGELPFPTDSVVGTLMARAETPFEPHPALGPLQSVLRRAGVLDPKQRMSAGELAASLMSSAEDLPRPTPLLLVGASVLVDGSADRTVHGRFPTVQLPAARPVPVEETAPVHRGPWAVLLVAILAVAVAAGITGWQSRQAETAAIPDVVGMSLGDALAELGEFGWELALHDVREPGTERDQVVRSEPVAGTALGADETLTLQISLGEPLVVVPEVVGLTVTDARDRLESLALIVGELIEQEDEVIAAGLVIAAVGPDSAQELEPGQVVDLLVSAGAADRTIPVVPVSGSPAEAGPLLLELRLIPVESREFSDTVPEGAVIRFDPLSGAVVAPDSEVAVVISDGPEPREVPAVIGFKVDEATATLEGAGFIVTAVQGSPNLPVLATDPPAGEIHPLGTKIIIATSLSS